MAIKIQGNTIIDDGRNIINAGITTVTSVSIGNTQVISSGRQLQNIASLDVVTTATIESSISNTSKTFSNLTVTGISTLGVTTTTNLTSQQLNVSGVTTVGFITATNLYVAGVGTFLSSGLQIRNPANTFGYTIAGGAIGADYTLTLPVVTSNTGIALTGVTNTFTGTQTFANLSASAAITFNTTASNILIGTGQTNPVLTLGGASQTGTMTLGQSTVSQTTNIQAGASGVGTTKTINLGTGGLANSNTAINIGPTAGVGTVSINAGTNLGINSTTPTSKLDVVGDAKVSGVVTATTFVGQINAGVSTLGVTTTTNLTAQQLNVSGVSTVGFITATNIWNAGITTSSRITLNGANDTTTGGGQIYLNGTTGNRIDFNTNGAAAPTFTTRSAGTKLVLYPSVGASRVDYAFGINANVLWSSVEDSGSQFKWYAGTTQLADLKGTGELVIGSSTLTGTASQRLQVTGGAYVSGSVGIGTTNPEKPLHLLSSVPTPLIVQRVSAANAAIEYRNPTSSMWAGLAGNALGWGVAAAENVGSNAQILVTRTGGELLVGSVSTTGTASQRLQVTGGAYISGDVGIGTTNPTSKLSVVGDGNFTGVVTATTFFGALTGTATTASSVTVNSVGLGTHTYGDYVKDITGTANQITVTSGTGEGSSPTISIPSQFTAPQDVTVTRDLQVNRNLNVNGNITIGGTSATLFTTEFKVYDPDIVLGFRTDALGNDTSTDNTANHGGIAIASTEGTPLISLYDVGIGETNPATYKKFMWFKSGTFSGLGTDAWISNYAIGIGSTQVPNGVRLAAGGMQVTDRTLSIPQLNVSGVSTLGTTTFTGNVSFGTSAFFGTDDRLILGDSSNLQLYYNSVNSIVSASAGLIVSGSSITYSSDAHSIQNAANTRTFANFAPSGTTFYYNNNTRLQINTSGITVTGTTFTDQLSVSGVTTSTGGFVGNLTGTATTATVAQGLTGTPNITVGVVTATSFVKSGGTSSQFLKADGSIDSSTYLTSYTETDTLNSVTGRGNSTVNGISVGILTATSGNFSGIVTSSGAVISGATTATSFVKSGGTSSQFLKADGSVDTSTYATQSYVGLATVGLASVSYVDSKVGLATVGLLASTGNGSNLTGIVTSIVAGTNVTISGSTGQVTINASGGGVNYWNQTAAGIHTLSNVGIGTTNPTENLSVLGKIQINQDSASNNRLIFRGQPSSFYRWNIDNFGSSNSFRIFREDDATSANGSVAVSISTTGTVTATKFSGDGSLLTGITAAGSGVVVQNQGSNVGTAGTLNFSTNLTASFSSGTATISLSNNPSISGILTADQVYTSNNGNGTNVRIGDDLWIGDINVANTIRFSGAQDSAKAFVVFGTSDAVALGRTGTGPLYYGGNLDVAGVVTATSYRGSGTNLTDIVTSIVAGDNITISGSTGQVTINSTGGGGGAAALDILEVMMFA